MTLSVIAAVATNGIIGRGGRLPWHLPDDLRRFKALTMGHAIVMGRRTWDSLGRPLPGRRSVVVSSDLAFAPDGAEVARSLEDALALCAQEEEVFVIGGARLFAAALPRAETLYLTRVHAEVEGDVRFPEWSPETWRLQRQEPHPADAAHAHPFTFLVYRRRTGSSAAA